MKLFCFPYAGGAAFMYYPFKSLINNSIELCPIELAGKGSRMGEEFNITFSDLINDAIESIMATGELKDFALFGYSMGGLIAYEVALRLYWKYNLKPDMIFLAACSPPHIYSEREKMLTLDDQTLIKELENLGGTSDEVMQNREMLAFYLPIIRSDFALLNDYNYIKPIMSLPVDFVVLYSEEENKDDSIREWERYTTKFCEYHQFMSGHFFINHQCEGIAEIINNNLVGK